MILRNFYTTQDWQAAEQSIRAVIRLNPQDEIFAGHFPGQPVVPGVCMIQIVKELLQRQLGRPVQLSQATQIKFLQPVIPVAEQLIKVSINWSSEEKDAFPVQAQWETEDGLCFKLNGVFRHQSAN